MAKAKEKKSFFSWFKRDQQMGARRAVVEEMFNDMYDDRRNIYLMNFIRGIFFGIGSVLGGTVIVALAIWLLSLFGQIPGLGDAAESFQETIKAEQSIRK